MKDIIVKPSRAPARSRKFLSMTLGGILAVFSHSSNATLGGDINSILDDQKTFDATLHSTKIGTNTEYLLTLPDGGIVYETVGDSGVVFEVRWKGQGHRPNMGQLLGTFADRYSDPNKKASPMDRDLSRKEGDFVIQSSVRNRYFKGRAYIPSLVPAGFDIN